MDNNFSASLMFCNVQSLPETPPLNKFGGKFENGWELYFQELDNHLQQLQSVQQVDEICVNRNGAVVTVTGKSGESATPLGVAPVMAFEIDGVSVDGFGNLSTESPRSFSITFIARE